MARRQVSMSEIVEIVYQWHRGRSIQGIERSFGTDRKTIRKYVRLAQAAGVCRDKPFPEGAELIGRMKALGDGGMLRKPPRTPGAAWAPIKKSGSVKRWFLTEATEDAPVR